ncbi:MULTISPECIES: hypothetical protein [unclassified Gordonia (in: high G+C Gram-positive bacteria)]|uniref:hypothetical protein n=1 Tax=unclassified Gordonia (in: high G+C Gram-positive bacteria) TaxID=2657482 RepID=UPI0011163EA9|nr:MULTISPECIES: hypothetical protein [unclassified Gordonia (in: high G+C Gram-positive bacteria)]MCX2755319.1 hypothetical protein [Gordonia sp. 4N]
MAINTDPAALARMAQELTRLEKSVQEATRRVRTQLNGSQWNDPVRKNFEDLLGNIERNSRTIAQMSNEGARMLKAKEQQIRTYMGR